MELTIKDHTAPSPTAVPRPRARRSTTFTGKGLLVMVDEEDGDAFTGLALITADDREYYLVGGGRAAALARHVDDCAIVWGCLERGPRGETFLRVRDFQVVHWSED